jgi:hypothetical protein
VVIVTPKPPAPSPARGRPSRVAPSMNSVVELPGELEVHIETSATVVFCEGCGERAEAHDRMRVELRDLSCFGRLLRLVWRKRRWRCRSEKCAVKTFTERSPHVIQRQQLTRRSGQEVCRQVGKYARSVSSVAGEFGICWASAMSAHLPRTPLGRRSKARGHGQVHGGGRDRLAQGQKGPPDPLRHERGGSPGSQDDRRLSRT